MNCLDRNEPEKGRSAITAFANSVLAINALADMTRGTTLNVGVVQGGSVANVVAAKLHTELDVRFWENEEYERVHKSLQSLCQQGFLDGVTTTLTRLSHKPAMAASEETQRLMALADQPALQGSVWILNLWLLPFLQH